MNFSSVSDYTAVRVSVTEVAVFALSHHHSTKRFYIVATNKGAIVIRNYFFIKVTALANFSFKNIRIQDPPFLHFGSLPCPCQLGLSATPNGIKTKISVC